MTTAIKITPDGDVTVVEVGEGDAILHGMYEHIGCDSVDVVRVTDDLDMWVDDEGMLKDLDINSAATRLVAALRRPTQWYYGTALLMGNNGPDSVDPPSWALLAARLAAGRLAPRESDAR